MKETVSATSPAPKREAAPGSSSVAQTSTATSASVTNTATRISSVALTSTAGNPATVMDVTAAKGFPASARRARATATLTTSARALWCAAPTTVPGDRATAVRNQEVIRVE